MNFLLHICCAPCAAHVIEELKERGFKVTAFFSNSNTYPLAEYEKRKKEVEKYCQEIDVPFIIDNYDHDEWLQCIKGFEKEPEGGKRCEVCYKFRLEKTADYAQQNNFQYFDSTLSISPHKNYEKIKKIGDELAEKYKLNFLGENWKKKDGYKKSCELSQQHNFYRQHYCGCEFSIRKNDKI